MLKDEKQHRLFQSPKSGQICLNLSYHKEFTWNGLFVFQSPKSGQICLNPSHRAWYNVVAKGFQSPKSGQICLNFANIREGPIRI